MFFPEAAVRAASATEPIAAFFKTISARNAGIAYFSPQTSPLLRMTIGVLKEALPETRVSLMPETAALLVKQGVTVLVERGAGGGSFAADAEYETASARTASRDEVLRGTDALLAIHPFEDVSEVKPGAILLGMYNPLSEPKTAQSLAGRGLTVFSMEMLPRTTRAQSMDVLSSQANIAGYKAVLLAATTYSRYFPMFMTAAGSIPPAKVLIIGAGVAGLQAIATAKRLGAVVEVSDTRPAVKEEVMSLGAKFIEVEGAADASKAGGYAVEQSEDFLRRQKERLAESVRKSDIIITTAQIPGRRAPVLIEADVVRQMKPGAVIVDLAASTGGNVAGTINGETVQVGGVTIIGTSTLPSSMPADASKLYAKNVVNFLKLILDNEGNLTLNFDDDLVKGTCIAHGGQVTNERVQALLQPAVAGS